MTNPLIQPFTTPLDAIPFDRIKTEHFLPAVAANLDKARAHLQALRDNTSAPNFENTLLTLETMSESLDLTAEVFFNLLSAEADEKMHALAKEISPQLAAFSNDIALDPVLFARVKGVYDGRAALNLSEEQHKLLEKSYKGFV